MTRPFFWVFMANFKNNLVKKLLGHATNVLGEFVEYCPVNGSPIKIRAIFDNEWEQVDPDTERVVSSQSPILGIRLIDLKSPPKVQDLVTILDSGDKYKVIDIREDGQGGASLFLHRQTARSAIERLNR